MESIFKRRSVRKFTDTDIEDAKIELLLKAGMRAPSAMNEQPWEFIVIKNSVTMESIIEFHPYATMLRQAKCAIVVCGNTTLQKSSYDYWIQDCSAATQNILLEATHLELGAVWLGVYPIEERVAGLQKLLQLPDSVIPLSIIALGYPQEEPKPIDTYLEERVHKEHW